MNKAWEYFSFLFGFSLLLNPSTVVHASIYQCLPPLHTSLISKSMVVAQCVMHCYGLGLLLVWPEVGLKSGSKVGGGGRTRGKYAIKSAFYHRRAFCDYNNFSETVLPWSYLLQKTRPSGFNLERRN